MKKDFENAYEDFFEAIDLEQIPNIQLYMDQVTTFMDEKLEKFKRDAADKIITKTMINNYTKDKILPPPEKKKYAPEQIMQLIMIFHLKHVLSITDIGKLINSTQAQEAAPSILYEMFTKIQRNEKDIAAGDIRQMQEVIASMTEGLNAGNSEEFQLLLLVLSLAVDAAAKKHMAEYLIDQYISSSKDKKEKKEK